MDLKIISYNILCQGMKGRHWLDRKEMVIDILKTQRADSFGVQEAHYDWMKTLCAALPEYDYVGVGRDDGDKDGEFSAVFYLKDKFDVVDSGTFWLSETPEKPSRGWDGACTRICSWAKLKCKKCGEEYVHMNTHLDHIGEQARTKGLALVLDFAKNFSEPVVLTGDFNLEEGSDLYKQMTAEDFRDAKHATDDTMHDYTCNSFYPFKGEAQIIIDFINVSKTIKVNKYRVLTDKPNGEYPSDHYPVVANITI